MKLHPVVWALATAAALAAAQLPSSPQLVVTALLPKGQPAAAITAAQVALHLGSAPAAVADWRPVPQVDLGVVLDEDTQHLGTGLADLKAFVAHLPASTAVAIVYMHTGVVTIAQALTQDHARAVAALRMPTGAADSSPSPYGSLQDLLARWARHPGRIREMVVLSDGQEHVGGDTGGNVTMEAALQGAVAAGVVVFTIYAPGANTSDPAAEQGTPLGAAGKSFSRFGAAALDTNQGGANLAQLSSLTGGEAYAGDASGSLRLTGFLDDITRRLASQYLLTFTPAPGTPTGAVGIKVAINDTKAKITAPKQVFLPKPAAQ